MNVIHPNTTTEKAPSPISMGLGDSGQAEFDVEAEAGTAPAPDDLVAVLALQLGPQVALLMRIEDEILVARKNGECISDLETHDRAVNDRIEATRTLIGSLEAKTLVGAAAQIMLAYNEVNFLGSIEITDEKNIEPLIAKIEQLCLSALSVVMREAGIDPRCIGAHYFASDSLYPFPTESCSGRGSAGEAAS